MARCWYLRNIDIMLNILPHYPHIDIQVKIFVFKGYVLYLSSCMQLFQYNKKRTKWWKITTNANFWHESHLYLRQKFESWYEIPGIQYRCVYMLNWLSILSSVISVYGCFTHLRIVHQTDGPAWINHCTYCPGNGLTTVIIRPQLASATQQIHHRWSDH